MHKVNVHCRGASVRRKTTIAVMMDFVFDSAKMESELNERFVADPHVEIRPSGTSLKVLLVTFPSTQLDTEAAILDVLGKIEDEVRVAVEAERMWHFIVTERFVVR